MSSVLAGPLGCVVAAFGWRQPRLNRAVPPPPSVGVLHPRLHQAAPPPIIWSHIASLFVFDLDMSLSVWTARLHLLSTRLVLRHLGSAFVGYIGSAWLKVRFGCDILKKTGLLCWAFLCKLSLITLLFRLDQ
jgi:hypothetical protein